MKTLSKHLFAALLGTALISSCSRPVAYFQPTAREQFKPTQTEAVAVVTPTPAVEVNAVETPVAEAAPVSAVKPVDQTTQAVSRVEAFVRNDNKLASNKKLVKRMDRMKSMLATTTTSKASLTPTTTTKKATLLERMALKRIDKQIKNKLSPERTMAKSLLTIGAIIAIIGLILILLNTATALGVIALIVGLVLILLDLLNVV